MHKKLISLYEIIFQRYPIINAIVLLSIYWVMDGALLNVTKDIGRWQANLSLLSTLILFCLYYVIPYLVTKTTDTYPGKDTPSQVKNKKKYVVIMFCLLILLTSIIPLGYDKIITNKLPSISSAYYPSQIYVLIGIAPIMEECIFRYFLYDKWARLRYGTIKGALITGFLFVICHPVLDLSSFILYGIPTVLFYLIYDSYGLYGSITAHILFNVIAL